MKNEKPIVIVGAGIIGLFTAYYLSEHKDQNIIIIDKEDGNEGCSFGNAGMVVPSHFIPLAAPGMIEKGLKWMLDSESPFYVKPRFSLSLLKWGIDFYKSANKTKIDRAIPALRDIGLLSKSLYQKLHADQIFQFNFEEKGLLMYCKEQHTLDEEAEMATLANKIGIKAKVLDTSQIKTLEPELDLKVKGAIYFEGDAHLYPNRLVDNLKKELKHRGVVFKHNTSLDSIENAGKEVSSIKTVNKLGEINTFLVSKLIICSGAWTQEVMNNLKLNLPIQAGKGYSVSKTQISGKTITIPNILVEARVAITPMGGELVRFGGTMEIGEINAKININRVKGILKSIPEYFIDYKIEMPEMKDIWYGLRPCSPDGLPYIGKLNAYSNVYVNSGHAMMGISLATGSGYLMSKIVNNQALDISVSEFKPERFD